MMGRTCNIWFVKYKEKESDEWKSLKCQKGYWYADPMLFSYRGEKYLFTEAFDMKLQIGRIAVSSYVRGEFTEPKVIIKSPYHMSYPCVFEYKDEAYMIPETSQNGTLEIWKACGNLYTWKKHGILLNKVRYADSTILLINGEVYLFSYEDTAGEYISHIYGLIPDTLEITEIENIKHDHNIKRPAGNFILQPDGKIFRPTQNNIKSYGESMFVNQVTSIKPYIESEVREILPKSLCWGGTKTHTLGYCDNLVVIDMGKQTEIPFFYRMVYIRKIRNGIYKLLYKMK
ncbi:MAG: hypothetical protein NC094_09685 [Bacteroidales bacterium]|nr:hypothetical protein [Lachnoclostridium sp.]MCM1384118.1 hypothetical protein [Lachnoclostridium sp.]MCM1465678.1 hypothetical protein [Bacteroidales bacterium]